METAVKGNFINGVWSEPREGDDFISVNPALPTQEIGRFKSSLVAASQAVEAAAQAFKGFRSTSLDERAALLQNFKQALAQDAELLTQAIIREAGKARWEAQLEVSSLLAKIDITLSQGRLEIERAPLPGGAGFVTHHPHGVMVVIGPFNFPLSLSHGHIVPALLAGNTVILKPSEQTPMVAQLYTEALVRAGFAPGVFNLVQGDGAVGQHLATHPRVNGVLFTGSYAVGRALKLATLDQPWKILVLEMGGKNSCLVFEDADYRQTLFETLFGAFVTAGQRCSATSRIVVVDASASAAFYERFVQDAVRIAARLAIGDPQQESTFMGPLISQRSLERYLHITQALAAHCEVVHPAQAVAPGYFVTPQIIALREPVPAATALLKEEIFGPALTIARAHSEEEALALANDTDYGLALSLFTASEARFERLLGESEMGLVNWNKSTVGAQGRLPFGGIKRSGNFHPAGSHSVRYCTYPVATTWAPCGQLSPAVPGFSVDALSGEV